MPPRRGSPSIAVLSLVIGLWPAHAVRADEVSPDSSKTYRDALWVTGSGALLGASLAGMFALKSEALNDRAASLLPGTAEVPGLERDARTAAHLALGFGVGALLFGAASVVLLVEGPSLFAAPSGKSALTPTLGPGSAGVRWCGSLP
jgi:hypothetical protein